MMRSFDVLYSHSEGWNETEVDVPDNSFAEMFNEIMSLVYQITDESGEKDIRIDSICEVPYEGEEKEQE